MNVLYLFYQLGFTNMKTAIYQDRYNAIKTWKVEIKNKTCYLTQFINGEQFGRRVKMTKDQIVEIGIFGFELLSVVEPKKVKFTFGTSKMTSAKTILAEDFADAKRLARSFLNVKRLPNDYYLSRLSSNIEHLFVVDIK